MKLSAALSLGVLTLALAACSTTPTNSTTNTAATPSVQASATTPTVVTSKDVDTVMNAFLVRTVDGAEVLEPVTAQTQIKKGDLVEYHVLLTNNGKDRVRDMRVALSLPAGAELQDLSHQASAHKPALMVRALCSCRSAHRSMAPPKTCHFLNIKHCAGASKIWVLVRPPWLNTARSSANLCLIRHQILMSLVFLFGIIWMPMGCLLFLSITQVCVFVI